MPCTGHGLLSNPASQNTEGDFPLTLLDQPFNPTPSVKIMACGESGS